MIFREKVFWDSEYFITSNLSYLTKRRNFLSYSWLLVAGCTAKTNTSQSSLIMPELLQLAVTDARGMEDLQRDYQPLRRALEELLATEIRFFPVDNNFAAAAALQSNQVDLVWAGPSEYVVIRARTNAVPIVAITRPEYYTVVIVRGDSGIKSLSDLQGKTIDMGNHGATSSHLGAIKILMDAGLNPQSDFQVIFSEENTLKPLKSREVDAWTRTLSYYQQALAKEGVLESEYPMIAKGQPFPSDVFIASSHLNPQIVNHIRALMLNNQEKILAAIFSVEALALKFKGSMLTTANDADYDMIREVYKAIGQGDFLE